MHELRLNLITREWVIISKKGNKRPEDFIARTNSRKWVPEFLDTCPFCPGNEAKTPDEKYRMQSGNGWSLRVVPNKYSVLKEEGEKTRSDSGLKKRVNGVGLHDIIIETPIHNQTTATIPRSHLENILKAYRDRFIAAYDDQRVEHVILFKNHGAGSGTSLQHPHAQVVGFPVTPLQVRNRTENSMRFFDETGECLACKVIKDELQENSRILLDTDHFVSLIPYAALSPFHIWIFPKRHSGFFGNVLSEELPDLTRILKATMLKLHTGLENPDFNYVIRSGTPHQTNLEFIHWYISIVPRVSIVSGFELGSGIYINPLVPETSAEFLRNVRSSEET